MPAGRWGAPARALAGTATGRAYDVVVFGATGFTGQRVRAAPSPPRTTRQIDGPDGGMATSGRRRKAQPTAVAGVVWTRSEDLLTMN